MAKNDMNEGPVTVQVDFKNGKQGTYECKKRPYFTYENNTATLNMVNGTTFVINMREIILLSY